MSRDRRIDAYIAKAQPFARPILKKLRERVHASLPRVEEAIKWGMPAYTLDGKIIVITAAFKAHAALNFWRGQELRKREPSNDAMGQFGRLESVDELPSDRELDRLIGEAAELAKTAPRQRRTKHQQRPLPQMHPEFADALQKMPSAKASLDSFPPSAQRDYIEWIAEAKQDSTRRKRIATAIEWLSEGKRRHWKHEGAQRPRSTAS